MVLIRSRLQGRIEEVVQVHATGRPILLGTVSVEESEQLAALLQQRGIDCSVLNARNDFLDAETIWLSGTVCRT